jgi:hypothetical protein
MTRPERMRNFSLGARRSSRVILRAPLRIRTEGSRDASEAWTTVVNKHGARCESKKPFVPEQEVGIATPRGQAALGKVVWATRQSNGEGNYEFAIELSAPENLFGISFPPQDWQTPDLAEASHASA